jgi:hypothetical protein
MGAILRGLALAAAVFSTSACAGLLGIDYLPGDQTDGEADRPADETGAADATAPDVLADANRGDKPFDRSVSSEGGDVAVDAEAGDRTPADTGSDVDAAEAAADAGPDGPGCTNTCILGSSQCVSGIAQDCQLQGSCTQWVTTTTCGPHQTCTAAADAGAACRCNSSICSQTGSVCQDGQTLATCATDSDGCLYVASTTTCTSPQTCSGMAPSAACSLTCSNSCTQGQTSCVSGSLATCTLGSNGCFAYGTAVACGVHQSCTGSAGSTQCICNTDPVCSAVGNVCSNSSTSVNCAQDGDGCFYQASSTSCTNGACGGGQCCTNACSNGATQCPSNSSTQLQTCGTGGNGCTTWTTSSCSGSYVCERYGTPSCVDPQWAEWPMHDIGNFTDNGNGTVTDSNTALVWQQAAGSAMTQPNAISYCSGLNLGGYTDWRLPSLVELLSIVDPRKGDSNTTPAIDTTYFPGTHPFPYWSTTLSASTSGDGWYIIFNNGSNTQNSTASQQYVRCVR